MREFWKRKPWPCAPSFLRRDRSSLTCAIARADIPHRADACGVATRLLLFAGGLFRGDFGFVPAGIGIEFLHGFDDRFCVLAQILLVYNSVTADDESHHAG